MRQQSIWAIQAELFRSPEAVQHQGQLRLSSHRLRSTAAKEQFILVSGRKPADFRGLGHVRDYSGADEDEHEADSSSGRRNSRVRRGFPEAWRMHHFQPHRGMRDSGESAAQAARFHRSCCIRSRSRIGRSCPIQRMLRARTGKPTAGSNPARPCSRTRSSPGASSC